MQFLRRSLVGIFLLAITLALFAWAGNTVRLAVQERMNAEPRSFEQRERVLSVNVVEVQPQTIAPDLTLFGELESARTLDLRAVVGGTVLEVSENFRDGGRVEAGELLVRIDPRDAQAALNRTRANLQDSQAELRDAERALTLASDELAAAEDQADLRRRALARQVDLADRGVGTAAAVENAELAASSAEQAVLSRRQALAQAEARVDQARTRLARTEIDLDDAERTLADTEIHAAFAGSLAEVAASPGIRVTANERLGQLIDPDQLDVSFRLSTSQYARLLESDGTVIGAPVTVSLAVEGLNLTAQGSVSRESALVGEGQTGRVLFARLDNTAGMRPGDFVTVTVTEPALDGVALVPATAVAADETVLVLNEENRLREAPVTLMRRQGDDVIIRAPDLAGQRIVAERSPLLGAGIAVQPLNLDEQRSAAPAEPQVISLDPERRARLVAFVEGSQMPDEAKARVLSQLEQDEVPADVVTRLETRMGG
ncbi:efflux RND transporter periplasmic adaptor subunit [Salibaculum griseiflavum]|uniref:Efflux transporter periplasmic adaptor subunit n=1 Tax=Salibaculum griseiflavum TaxID=1914409 RepID=A0A2V1P443_9RHOB|nr:efflux RND transporter periplasmic adaptor subunit [Salibaculum griseiflavum]PWG16518.1 efflux transporter periplasmic adaptor subunit [Salibaculum griseiflavum]